MASSAVTPARRGDTRMRIDRILEMTAPSPPHALGGDLLSDVTVSMTAHCQHIAGISHPYHGTRSCHDCIGETATASDLTVHSICSTSGVLARHAPKTHQHPTTRTAPVKGVVRFSNAPKRSQEPDPGQMAGPEHYESEEAHFLGEVRKAFEDGNYVRHGGFYQPTTSEFKPFSSKPESLALYGLYGCTSVLVVSEKGVWATHSKYPYF